MIFALILIIVGVAIGLVLPLQSYAISSSFYTSVGILAAIDSIVGAIKASYDEEFDLAIFASGLFLNTLMAVALSWVGDKIGVPLYFAAVFVFGTRLFNNLALIRRRVIERIRKNIEYRKIMDEKERKPEKNEEESEEKEIEEKIDRENRENREEREEREERENRENREEEHRKLIVHRGEKESEGRAEQGFADSEADSVADESGVRSRASNASQEESLK